MPTFAEYLQQPLGQRLARLERAPDDVAAAIRGRADAALSRRPEPSAWCAKEIVCHLRDIEELCMLRYHAMLVMDDPKLFVVGLVPTDPREFGIVGGVPYPIEAERWAEERQYLRNDTEAALAAFRRRRREALTLLRTLSDVQWQRGAIVPALGRRTIEELATNSAAHDDNHLAQLKRALYGLA